MWERCRTVCFIFLVFVCSTALLVSCTKEGLRESPEQPGMKGPVYPENADLSKEDRIISTEVEREKDWAAEREKEMAALRAQTAQEMATMTAREQKERFEQDKVYFAFDSAVLTGASKATLLQKAYYMTSVNKDMKLLIEGHCDERGSVEYNLALGQRRAEAARNYLANIGVDAARIDTVSYGKERPVDPGHDEEAWAKNRRDEFVIR